MLISFRWCDWVDAVDGQTLVCFQGHESRAAEKIIRPYDGLSSSNTRAVDPTQMYHITYQVSLISLQH